MKEHNSLIDVIHKRHVQKRLAHHLQPYRLKVKAEFHNLPPTHSLNLRPPNKLLRRSSSSLPKDNHLIIAPSSARNPPNSPIMGLLLSTVRGTLNILLPFTNPSTPLLQDILHTIILCTTLYYAPQIADYYKTHHAQHPPETHNPAPPPDDSPIEDIPIDDTLVLQDSDNDGEDPTNPLPHAPTPPPEQAVFWANVPPDRGDVGEIEGEAGPAERPPPTRANRVIGAKKAKSLARRDQRRAYHEFQRSQAEERRRLEEHGREEREAARAAEKARRAEVEREIMAAEQKEREARKEEQRKEQEAEMQRRERVVNLVREKAARWGYVDLVDIAIDEGKDRIWIERLVRASGMLVQIEGSEDKTMITGDGYLVKIDVKLMRRAYEEAAASGDSRDGKVSSAEFGDILEKAVRQRAEAMV